MKITVSLAGKFHAFHLAAQLEKRGALSQFITSYPPSVVAKSGIPREKIRAFVPTEVLARAARMLPSFITKRYSPQYALAELHDTFALRALEPCDLCVMWSSFGLHTLREAKRRGIKTVIERGSSHILHQTEILKEEYGRFGLSARVAHPRVVEKELQEYEEADAIAVPSTFVKRTFVERGVPEGKIIQVPYGVDLSAFRQEPRRDDVFRVIFAGGMSIRKGVHYLLRAFAELNLSNAELLLIGSMNKEMEPFFKKYEGLYRWVGHVPYGELSRYYSEGSVFAHMSVEEGLALVLPQAMACGLPVIATRNSGAEDIVRDGKDGFVIAARDVAALKEKLRYCHEHREVCARMGVSAKERVATGFTWDDYGERITAAYATILGN